MDKAFAEIIVSNKCRETDRIYNYMIPDSMKDSIRIGSRVLVPFGISNKQTEAYVVGLTDKVDIAIKRIKKISKLIDEEPVISESLVQLSKWMKNKYISYYIEAIQTVIPAPVRLKSNYIITLLDGVNYEEKLSSSTSEYMWDIIDYLRASGGKSSLAEVKQYFSDIKIDYYLKKLIEYEIIEKKQSIKNKINKKVEKLIYINDLVEISISKNANKQAEIIEIVKDNPGISLEDLKMCCPNCLASYKTLVNKKILNIVEIDKYRQLNNNVYKDKKHELTKSQCKALMDINENFRNEKNIVLHGVTGSGKTEIYLQIIQKYIDKGMDAIVLVPEISLTPQMIDRFKGRFGDNVAVLHSSLSEGEKYDEWRKIKAGKVNVAVGARSAVFAPFSKLGIIIIDEEHENTYKSDIRPKYITREVAEKRCELEGARLILGSATPSIETYYRTQINELGLVNLSERINGRSMPEVMVVDMREELKNGNKTIFSLSMTEAILNTLKSKNQIILFLNRRGHSTFVSCRECGLVMKCPRCSISMTYHMGTNKLCCHYCGYERNNPRICPKCSSNNIRYFGVGTQKLEKEFQLKFGIKNTLRMDADTTGRKNSHEKIIDKFRNRECDVLLGTQMISKGLDFPDVTMVGVITADTSINLPDFRAAEKTFQMIAQVAGRSGRGDKKGNVIVQTYSPEHYSIQYAKKHDYEGFYNQEIRLRKELEYPPFSNITTILVSGINEKSVIRVSNRIGLFIKNNNHKSGIEILGPVSAPLGRIKNKYRWQIILKASNQSVIREIIVKMLMDKQIDMEGTNISIDLNPYNML